MPALWPTVKSNRLPGAQRRKRLTAEKRRALAAGVAALRLRVDREPVALRALEDFASRHPSSAGDATHLERVLCRRCRSQRGKSARLALSNAGVEVHVAA